MRKSVKIAVMAICAAASVGAATKRAPAISLELAKKCRAMALQAHPYKLPGEKGPGSATAERDYYNKCVANGGNMPEQNSGTGQHGGSGQTEVNPSPAAPTK
jgi:hypothetical protein